MMLPKWESRQTSEAAGREGDSGGDLIAVARIARPQGLRGEVIADILTDFPDRFTRLRDVRLRTTQGTITRTEIERSRLQKNRVVLKLRGCDRIEDAELLRGATVAIERRQLVPLPPDTWYNFDLIGCEVFRQSGSEGNVGQVIVTPPIGRVVDVQEYGAAPLLIVDLGEDREAMVPLVASICIEVDVRRRRIVIDPPDGLLDEGLPD
jgi:16S rRNA processing protein RimM